MPKQVKFFYGDVYSIEEEINEWLKENNEYIKNVQISLTHSQVDELVACVYYIWTVSQDKEEELC